jgi:hypothetical protein
MKQLKSASVQSILSPYLIPETVKILVHNAKIVHNFVWVWNLVTHPNGKMGTL